MKIPRSGLENDAATSSRSKFFAFLLVVLSLFSGIGTFAFPEKLPFFLLMDGALLLVLILMVLRRIFLLWKRKAHNKDGAQLNLRVVSALTLLVMVPTVFMAIFSAIFLHRSVDGWFNEKVRSALYESSMIANAYFAEHQKVIVHNVNALARELETLFPLHAIAPSDELNVYLSEQASLRSLNEVVIFNLEGRVLGRSLFSYALEFEPVSAEALANAREKVFSYANQRKDRVIALTHVIQPGVFLIASRLVDPHVLERIAVNKNALDAYETLFTEREAVFFQMALLFFLITFLVLLLTLWMGIIWSDRLMRPLSALVEAAASVSQGDLTVRLTTSSKDTLRRVSGTFNQMVSALQKSHTELSERRLFIENVLNSVSSGIFVTDTKGNLIHTNKNAALFLQKTQQVPPEFWRLYETLEKENLSSYEETIPFARNGLPCLLRVYVQKIEGEKNQENVIIALNDITDFIAAQRQAAWAEIAKRIAHEIKNPLTPIQLAAERLKRRYMEQILKDSDVFASLIETIINQVRSIGKMIFEFSNFARIPAPKMQKNDLKAVCQNIILLEQEAYPLIAFSTTLPPDPLFWMFDADQINQVLINLIKNAIEALHEKGAIHVRLEETAKEIILQIEDNGMGFGENLARLTEPYVTSKKEGWGLGLAVVRRIVEDHGGTITFQNASSIGGASVLIVFRKADSN